METTTTITVNISHRDSLADNILWPRSLSVRQATLESSVLSASFILQQAEDRSPPASTPAHDNNHIVMVIWISLEKVMKWYDMKE